MNKPFYASQLEQIRDLMLQMGVKSFVADDVVVKLSETNGTITDEEFPFEDEETEDETTLG